MPRRLQAAGTQRTGVLNFNLKAWLLQPSIEHAPDYHTFVPLSNVVILPEMQKKAKAGRYLSLEHFR